MKKIEISNMSLRDLRNKLPSTKGKNVPPKTWFKEHPEQILFEEHHEGSKITVYENGFYTYTEDGGAHVSILRVDNNSSLRYDFADGSSFLIEENEYLDCSCLVALYIFGQNQWTDNVRRNNEYWHGFFIENDTANFSAEFELQSAEEEVLAMEEKQENQEALAAAIKVLSPQQQEIIRKHFWQNYTQEQIAAQLGISRASVRTYFNRSLKRMKSFFPEGVAI